MTIVNESPQEIARKASETLQKKTTISIDDSVKNLLDALKIIPAESYNSEILRLIKNNLALREVPA